MKPLAILAAVLALVYGPALFAQTGAEWPVSTPVYGPATAVYGGTIASDGKQFMAVWTDLRSGWRGVYASRIAPDGTVLDPLGILIGTGEGQSLGIAWNGESYRVVWNRGQGMMIASLSPDGRVVVAPFMIENAYLYDDGSVGARQLIASNGTTTIVVTAQGWLTIHEPERVVERHSFSGNGSFRSVYRTGDEFTLVPGIDAGFAVRLDSKGQLLRIAKSAAAASAISCHEEHCIQVYPDPKSNRLDVVSYDGVAEASGTPVELPITKGRFSLISTNGGYLLVTDDNSMQRFDSQGLPVGTPVPPCCTRAASIVAASDGVNVAVLRWVDSMLSVTMVTPAGVLAPRNVATSANSQVQPAIAGSGSNYLVAWRETDGAYFGRVALDGTILDGRGRVLSPPGYGTPSLAFDGVSYIAATHRYGLKQGAPQVVIARIDPATGNILNVNTTCGYDMRIGRSENATVAVWIDCSGNLDIASIDDTGALAPAPITLVLAKSPDRLQWLSIPFLANPRLAWNGSEWLVMWEEPTYLCGNCPTGTKLYVTALRAMPVSAALMPAGGVSQLPPGPHDSGPRPDSTRLASDGHDFLSVWRDDAATILTSHIAASGVPSGAPLEAFQSSFFSRDDMDIVWGGTTYSTAYSKALRSDQGQGNNSGYDYQSDLGIVRLSSSGAPAGSTVISATNDDEYDAALLPLGGGRIAAAYVRVAHDSIYAGAERVFLAAPGKPRGRAVRSVSP